MKQIIIDGVTLPYSIATDGTITNLRTNISIAGSLSRAGYVYIRFSVDGQKYRAYLHRLLATHFIPNPENYPIVNHKDGNKQNNTLSNLEWVTYSQNVKHAHDNDLIQKRREYEYYDTDLSNEKWVIVKQNTNYLVSNMGRVRGAKRNILLRASWTLGYKQVALSLNGKVTNFLVHHLVYTNFYDDHILEGFVINHINGDGNDNRLENLEKVTPSENVNKALYETQTNTSTCPVAQYDLEGNFIQTFPSIAEAGRQTGTNSSYISQVCRGNHKQAKGYIYKYHNI